MMLHKLRRPNLLESQTAICPAGDFHHDAVDLRFQDVRCEQSRPGIKAIHAKEENIRAQLPQSLLRNRSD